MFILEKRNIETNISERPYLNHAMCKQKRFLNAAEKAQEINTLFNKNFGVGDCPAIIHPALRPLHTTASLDLMRKNAGSGLFLQSVLKRLFLFPLQRFWNKLSKAPSNVLLWFKTIYRISLHKKNPKENGTQASSTGFQKKLKKNPHATEKRPSACLKHQADQAEKDAKLPEDKRLEENGLSAITATNPLIEEDESTFPGTGSSALRRVSSRNGALPHSDAKRQSLENQEPLRNADSIGQQACRERRSKDTLSAEKPVTPLFSHTSNCLEREKSLIVENGSAEEPQSLFTAALSSPSGSTVAPQVAAPSAKKDEEIISAVEKQLIEGGRIISLCDEALYRSSFPIKKNGILASAKAFMKLTRKSGNTDVKSMRIVIKAIEKLLKKNKQPATLLGKFVKGKEKAIIAIYAPHSLFIVDRERFIDQFKTIADAACKIIEISLGEEGVFRLAGNRTLQPALIRSCLLGSPAIPKATEVHDWCDLLKVLALEYNLLESAGILQKGGEADLQQTLKMMEDLLIMVSKASIENNMTKSNLELVAVDMIKMLHKNGLTFFDYKQPLGHG